MASILQFPRGSFVGAGLFRPKIVRMMPSARGGADRKYEGLSEDGHSWVLKLGDSPLAISEWLGYKLSEVCGIAVPYHQVVELPGGDLAFGSRVEGGLEDLSTDAPPIANVRGNRDYLSKIYALDLAISNDDRHPSNILWRKNGMGALVPMSIDFSRALLVQKLPLPDIRELDCKTTHNIRVLRHIDAWNPTVAGRTLETVRNVKSSAIADWIDRAPQEWINELDRSRFLNWWGSSAFQTRIDGCMMFCS